MLTGKKEIVAFIGLLDIFKIWEPLNPNPGIWRALDMGSQTIEVMNQNAIVHKICEKEGHVTSWLS